jgi:amino acid adenylation domain-containing protein
LPAALGKGILVMIEDVYELSHVQQAMLRHSRYGGDSGTYIAQNTFEVDGPLDLDILQLAWEQTIAAHPSLRASFHWDDLDQPLQLVHREPAVPVYQHDWTELDEPEQRVRFDHLMTEDRQAGFFNLSQPPLQRVHLIRLGEDRHGCIWTHHTLSMDAWSEVIVMNDVTAWYRHLAIDGPPPEPAVPYRDYIGWLQRQDLDAAREFWAAHLSAGIAGSLVGPLLPVQREGQAGPVTEVQAKLSPSLSLNLRATASRHQVTFNTLVQAAWAFVLQRYNGEPEVTFGCTTSGRPVELPGVDRMVGSFVNSLPVQVAVPDDGDVGEWLREIQQRARSVRRFEYSPDAQIKSWIDAPGPEPLVNSLVVLNNFPSAITLDAMGPQQLSFRLVKAFETTSEPLTLKVYPGSEPSVRLLAHRQRFEAASVTAIMTDFQAALEAICGADRVADVAAAIGRASVVGEGRALSHPAGQGTSTNYADGGQTLPGLIERQARATPDAVALLTEQGSLTYRELLDRSLAVAEAVEAADVTPGQVVGVCAERSPEMVTGILGALFAGAAYLPLDPTLPASRLAFMIDGAGAGVILAQKATAAVARNADPGGTVLSLEDLPGAPSAAKGHAASPDGGAYVMYTSGSTGQPKGVSITHRAIVNRLLWMQETFGLTPADRVLQKTPFGFDVSVWEFFWPLIAGSGIVIARPSGHQDSEYLARTIADRAVTTAHFVPSMLQLFLEEPTALQLRSLRRVLCSGEELPFSLAERFGALLPGVELHNLYGPTEAAVDVTWWDCSRPGPPGIVPIGSPIANTAAYVLDRRLDLVPDDVPGELYLGGVQLARGYLNRPGLTAARFVAHPLAGPGGRLYRTGDRVRRLPDGSIVFLGRLDRQVKLRGYRIELSEIEQVLLSHPQVREAAVIVVEGATSARLAAYVTGPAESGADELREYLRSQLPRYMVPATINVLPTLPLTRNGKADRAALPQPVRAIPAGRSQEPIQARPVRPWTAAATSAQ